LFVPVRSEAVNPKEDAEHGGLIHKIEIGRAILMRS